MDTLDEQDYGRSPEQALGGYDQADDKTESGNSSTNFSTTNYDHLHFVWRSPGVDGEPGLK